MNQKHYLSQAAVAMTLMLCLAGCGTDKDMGSTAPSTSVSPSPVVTEDTGSTMTPDSSREDRDSGVEDSAVDRPAAETPTDTPAASENPSTQEGGSQAGEDMKRAGEDLGDAAQNAGRSIENGLKGQ